MASEQNDRSLWEAVVAAEQRVAECRADFYQQVASRPRVLASALVGSTWEQRAALCFLRSLPDDVPDLLDDLVDHAMSDRWALLARQAIAAGVRSRRDTVLPRVREIVAERLSTADAIDYRRLAELLAGIQVWDALALLVQRAGQSENGEINEVGDDFREGYGPMLSRRET